jgi:hypothetical protein
LACQSRSPQLNLGAGGRPQFLDDGAPASERLIKGSIAENGPVVEQLGGFTFSGPLVIPGVYNGRNRTFFFGSFGIFFSRYGRRQQHHHDPHSGVRDMILCRRRQRTPVSVKPVTNRQFVYLLASASLVRIVTLFAGGRQQHAESPSRPYSNTRDARST